MKTFYTIGICLLLAIGIPQAQAQASRLGPHGTGVAVVSYGCAAGVTPPAPAAANGLTCLAFDADFSLATDPANGNQFIDTTNSLAPGSDFFINNGWPGQAAGQSWQNFLPTPSGDYNISGVSLNLTTTSPTEGSGVQFTSCGYSGTSTPVGQAFLPPYYVDVTVTAISGGTTSYPSQWADWWSMPTEFLTNTSGTVTFVEIDNGEYPFGRHVHTWVVSGGATQSDTQVTTGAAANTPGVYGMLVIPPSLNGGSTLIAPYLNEVFDNSVLSIPGLEAGPGQVGYEGGIQHACFIMNAGYGWNLSISKYQVWTLPP